MTFLAPLGLALGALSLPIVGLYFLKVRRQRVRVPSLLLWQEAARVQKLATPFERFRRNLMLWLQLLLVLLFALAVARPYIEAEIQPGRSLVLVVDVSASMGATDADPTRLAAAVTEARRAVGDLGSGDEVLLVVSGATTEVRVPFTLDHHEVDAALAALVPTGAEGSLRQGVELAASLARTRPAVEIVVLSDGGAGDLGQVDVGSATVRFVPVGRGDRNAGVLALDLRRSPVSERDRQLFVTVQEFGGAPVQGTVEVSLDGKVVGMQTLDLVPVQPASLVFDLPGDARGVLKVHLDTPGDLLAADDDAYNIVSPAAEREVLLVGVDRLTARVLQADPRFHLQVASSSALTTEQLAAVDAVVFGVNVPPVAGTGVSNVLVLGPFDGGPASFGVVIDQPRVLSWRRTHPTQRFVEWDGVLFARGRAVRDQGGLVAVVEGDQGPLVLAGERGGARWVELAFNPMETDLPLRVAWPVLVLNAVGWLTEESGDTEAARVVAAGTPFVRRIPAGFTATDAVVKRPDGTTVPADVDEGVLRVRDTSQIGVYALDAGSLSTRFAANLLSPRESDIRPQSALSLGPTATAPAQAHIAGRREIWRELLLAAIALLSLEWLAWHRRRSA